jgi:molybdate transport system ATP-binding protein
MPAEILWAQVAVRQHAFDVEVSLEVPPGVTALFGPSGAGKSTTLAAIAGLLRPQAGRVQLGDEIWFDSARSQWVPPHRRGIAFVFQAPSLFPHLSILSNVLFGIDRALPRQERRERAEAMLERMRVGHLAHRAVGSLSGGEAQRVALARAFARQPRLILLDEPFCALHHRMRAELVTEVREYVLAAGLPMIHVTHHRAEARAIADRVALIERGRIEGVGGPELLSSPRAFHVGA